MSARYRLDECRGKPWTMSLAERLRAVAAAPADLKARAELAETLSREGATEEADAVWLSTARLACGRGEFFVALALGRRYLDAERLEALLREMAARYGAGRARQGPVVVAPQVPAIEGYVVPEDADDQLFAALKLSTDVDALMLPKYARMPAIPIFEELPPDDFMALAHEVEPVLLREGLELLKQDSVERKVFLLVQGQAKATTRRADGGEIALGVRKGPTLLGEVSLLTEAPRRTSLTALGPGIAWRIDAQRVLELGNERPALVERLRALVKDRLLSDLFQSSQVLAGVPNRDAVVAAFTVRTFPRGAVAVEQGAPPPGLFFLLHGRGEVWVTDPDGNAGQVADLDAGDAFGEMSLLTGQPTTARIVLPEGGIALHLSAAAWNLLKAKAPELDQGLAQLADVRRGELQGYLAEGTVELVEDAVDDAAWAIEDAQDD
jgi:CRP-like cAMP-binding protein